MSRKQSMLCVLLALIAQKGNILMSAFSGFYKRNSCVRGRKCFCKRADASQAGHYLLHKLLLRYYPG